MLYHLLTHSFWWDLHWYPISHFNSYKREDSIFCCFIFTATSGKLLKSIKIKHKIKFFFLFWKKRLTTWHVLFHRLTIPLAFTIGFFAGIVPYLSSGPFFPYFPEIGSPKGCEKYGWLNVVYLNIYIDKIIKEQDVPWVSIRDKIRVTCKKMKINFSYNSNWQWKSFFYSAWVKPGTCQRICSFIGCPLWLFSPFGSTWNMVSHGGL